MIDHHIFKPLGENFMLTNQKRLTFANSSTINRIISAITREFSYSFIFTHTHTHTHTHIYNENNTYFSHTHTHTQTHTHTHTHTHIYIYIYYKESYLLFFKQTKERNRRYPAQIITGADYANDIALLTNVPAQAETLPHSLKWAAAGIGFHVNAHKTESMCFN